MRSSTVLSAVALFGCECAAQWNGVRTLAFNAVASNININDVGGSQLVSYANGEYSGDFYSACPMILFLFSFLLFKGFDIVLVTSGMR
jgi:hypothetical protein